MYVRRPTILIRIGCARSIAIITYRHICLCPPNHRDNVGTVGCTRPDDINDAGTVGCAHPDYRNNEGTAKRARIISEV